jgi:multiple antibiotic resistance protein
MELKDFWICFVPLFVAVDAIGTLPIYMSLTNGADSKVRSKILIYSVITATVVAMLFIFVGEAVLRMLGVTIADFMIAGGIILFLISISDIVSMGKPIRHAVSESVGPVPIGVPLIVGPAVLTTILLLVREYGFFQTALATFVNILIAGIIFYTSQFVIRILGTSGTKIVSKIASLFLAAIAVMMVRKGITIFLQ